MVYNYRVNLPIMSIPLHFPTGPMSVSCTPHFKPDAESPWVTKESITSVHYWFNPEKRQTLLEVVEQIEGWIYHDFSETAQEIEPVCKSCFCAYSINIWSMEIRGVKYNRETLRRKTTFESLCNEEPFTLRLQSRRIGCCTVL